MKLETARSVPEREAVERFRLAERLGRYGLGFREAEEGVFVYHVAGNLRIEGDLALDWDADHWRGHAGLFVDGDLEVTGDIINADGDSGPFLVVSGALRARNVVAGGSEVKVDGDADIAGLLLGHYNHGRVGIEGATRARLIISDDHSMSLNTTSPYWDGHAFPYGMPLADYLHADVPLEKDDDDEYVDDTVPPYQSVAADVLIERLRRGLPVLRDPNDPRPLKTAEQWRADVESHGAVLRYVPRELIDPALCLAAVRSNGYAIEYVPEELRTPELVDEALAQNGDVISELPAELITPARARVALEKDGANLRYVPEPMRTPELCILALEHDKDGFALHHIPEERLTPELCVRAVQNDPMELMRIPERLRTFEVSLAAVRGIPWMLDAVPEAIREEVRIAAGIEPSGPVSPEVRELLDSNPSKLRLFLFVLTRRPMMAVLLRGLLSIAFLVVHIGITIYVWKSFGAGAGIAVFLLLCVVSVAVSVLGNIAFRRAVR